MLQKNNIIEKLDELTRRIAEAESKIADFARRKDSEVPARIATLREQLKKIDEYAYKINTFRAIAEAHLESRNLPTIEAPPSYRVNLNRLRNWAMMIDPLSPNDPYAQRVYLTARCDEMFLAQKKKEFSERIAQLEGGEVTLILAETEEQKELISEAQAEMDRLINSPEMSDFAEFVTKENGKYTPRTDAHANTPNDTGRIALGAYAVPMPSPEAQQAHLKQLFGKYYDSARGTVLLPAEIPTETEFAVLITCTPTRIKQLDTGLRNLILNTIGQYPVGEHKVIVLDTVRYDATALGSLKSLESTPVLEPIPQTPELAAALLEQIVSGFSEMDDVLEAYDTAAEYNREAEPANRLPRTTLILFGGLSAFENSEHLQRILTEYERYGISFFVVILQDEDEETDGLAEYIPQSAVHIRMLPNETTIQMPGEEPQPFVWYTLTSKLSDAYAGSIRQATKEKEPTGSAHPKPYDIGTVPPYTRQYKPLELPFGADTDDQVHCLSFGENSSAACLSGASDSGKSALLHTLIAGIICKYHPDNAEIWLADFVQSEFEDYITHRPPHIKYILQDVSAEPVYDFIDRISEITQERQQAFERHGAECMEQIDPMSLSEPMPLIFIVLEGFSVMSQVIASSEVYRQRWEALPDNAPGIYFLFSDQSFSEDVLTSAAKERIQQRIAMKGTVEEIRGTLDLSGNQETEEVQNWMEALPPYCALFKCQNEIQRVNVLHFPDNQARNEMIDRINQGMTAAECYAPEDIHTYRDKKPIIAGRNTCPVPNEQ